MGRKKIQIKRITDPKNRQVTFNKRRVEPANFPKLLSKNFMIWYLSYAHDFAEKYQVPMIVDQFGATTLAPGQLAYEQDAIDVAEAYGFGWSRWGYNAGSSDRVIPGNPAVHAFYQAIGAARAGP